VFEGLPTIGADEFGKTPAVTAVELGGLGF